MLFRSSFKNWKYQPSCPVCGVSLTPEYLFTEFPSSFYDLFSTIHKNLIHIIVNPNSFASTKTFDCFFNFLPLQRSVDHILKFLLLFIRRFIDQLRNVRSKFLIKQLILLLLSQLFEAFTSS